MLNQNWGKTLQAIIWKQPIFKIMIPKSRWWPRPTTLRLWKIYSRRFRSKTRLFKRRPHPRQRLLMVKLLWLRPWKLEKISINNWFQINRYRSNHEEHWPLNSRCCCRFPQTKLAKWTKCRTFSSIADKAVHKPLTTAQAAWFCFPQVAKMDQARNLDASATRTIVRPVQHNSYS